MTQGSRALAGDVGGSIRRLAMQIDADQFDEDTDLRLAAYANLLKSFDPSTIVILLLDDFTSEAMRAWVDSLDVSCRIERLTIPGKRLSASRAWIRDAFLPGALGGSPCYFRPRIGKLGAEAASHLSAVDGVPVIQVYDIVLDGGDSIVAGDFRLVGVEAVHRTCNAEGFACSLKEAITRLESLDPRPMTVVGYRPSALESQAASFSQEFKRRMQSNEKEATSSPWGRNFNVLAKALRTVGELLRTYLLNELIQDWAHIDVAVSPTGVDDGISPQLLVAQTLRPTTSKGEEFNAWQRLEALAKYLSSCGFRVSRNPTAFDQKSHVTLWYNNILLQTDPRVVWVPQYALADGTYQDIDEANVTMWENLGYSVRPVAGWHAFLRAEGALRCSSNVVERS